MELGLQMLGLGPGRGSSQVEARAGEEAGRERQTAGRRLRGASKAVSRAGGGRRAVSRGESDPLGLVTLFRVWVCGPRGEVSAAELGQGWGGWCGAGVPASQALQRRPQPSDKLGGLAGSSLPGELEVGESGGWVLAGGGQCLF